MLNHFIEFSHVTDHSIIIVNAGVFLDQTSKVPTISPEDERAVVTKCLVHNNQITNTN